MRKSSIFTLLFLLSSGINGLVHAETKKYNVNVTDFQSLQVINDINVIYKSVPDSVGLAVFEANDASVNSIMFTNNNGKLKIEKNIDVPLPDRELPVVTVYSNFLQSAENCGNATLTIISPAPGAVFKAKIIGNGKIVATGIHATQTEGNIDTGKGTMILEGITKDAKFRNIGTGTLNALALESKTATANCYGTGNIECFVTDELTVKGAGSGKVMVKGHPKIKKRTVGISIVEVE